MPVLRGYSLKPGQTVRIDTGNYIHVRNVLISNDPTLGNDEGFTITGPLAHVATIDRANPYAGSTNIELSDARLRHPAAPHADRRQNGAVGPQQQHLFRRH